VLRYNSMFALVSLGMCFVIMTGGIDLSVGSVAALSSVVARLMSPYGLQAGSGRRLLAGMLQASLTGDHHPADDHPLSSRRWPVMLALRDRAAPGQQPIVSSVLLTRRSRRSGRGSCSAAWRPEWIDAEDCRAGLPGRLGCSSASHARPGLR
jgi:ribose transport system permease protein